MAQTIYKGVIYNTDNIPAPKFQSNLGAQLGLAGAIPAPPSSGVSPVAGAAVGAVAGMPNGSVPAPKYNVNDQSFLDMSPQARLDAFKADPTLAQQEILRDKTVYGQKYDAGDMTGANAAHSWADQVRQVAGISNNDPVYGNVPAPPQIANQGTFIDPQKATGVSPVAAQSTSTTQMTSAPPQSIPQSNVPPTQSGSIYTPLSTKEIQDEAKSRIDQMFGGLKQAVDYAKTGLRNNFDYANQVTNARRVMEDQQLSRSVSPFSGRLNYLQQGFAFDRGLQDTAANKDFNAAMAAQDQKLSDFQAMAPEQQQALYDQLLRAERDFGLQLGTLTGNIGGTPTLAKTAQDAQYTGMYGGQMTFPAMLQMAQLTGQLPNGQSTLAGKQANLDAALQVGQQRGQVLAPTQTWGDLFTQQGAPNYQAIRDSIKDQQYQQQFDENTRQFGLDYALRKASQDGQLANQAADNARASEANQISRDKLALDKQQTAAAADNDFISNLRSLYTAKDPITNQISITDPQSVRSAIIAKYYPDDAKIDQVLLTFGLKPNQ